MLARKTPLIAILGASLLPVVAAAGDKLEKDQKKWLEEEVAAIILPSEEKTFRDLKKDDRAEFQKIFWARRDPDPETPKPENEFKAEYTKKRAEADQKFRAAGRPGAATDCGRVFLLLGEADQVRPGPRAEGALAGRGPEIWVYRDSPRLPFRIKAGQLEIEFDESCQLAQGSRLNEQLVRVAETKVQRPNLDYRVGKDGRLVKLADQLPKPSPAQSLLKEPRQDFPIAAQASFLKVVGGGTALVGLVQGEATGLTVQETAGKKAVKLVVCGQAIAEDGRAGAFYEQATTAEVGPDNRFVASYRLELRPGKYSVRAGALDEVTKKGSLATTDVEVPDLNTGELTLAGPIILKDIEENATNDPAHPLGAFLLGNARLVPHFGSTYSKTDSVSFFYQYYDAKRDEATGKASVVVALAVLKGGKTPVARAADQPSDTVFGGNVVGPVTLEKYEPGPYLLQLKIKDNLANKELTREVPFEVK